MDFKLIKTTYINYDEIIYLDEWLNFHKKQGFDYQYLFLFYDKEENKNEELFKKIKNKYQHEETIIIKHIKFYQRGLIFELKNNYYDKHKDDYIFQTDIDEFLYSPLENKTVKDIVNMYFENNIEAIFINFRMFGSNWLKTNPEFKVLEKFTLCNNQFDSENLKGKSIVKLKLIDFSKNLEKCAHTFPLIDNAKYFNTNMQEKKNLTKKPWCPNKNQISDIEQNPLLILNHYKIRSQEECLNKDKNNFLETIKNRYKLNNFKELEKKFNKIKNIDILKKI
jgi:hypothetical protein